MTESGIDTAISLRLALLKKKKKRAIREFCKIPDVSCFACCATGQVFCEEALGNVCIDINRKEFSFHESLDCQ